MKEGGRSVTYKLEIYEIEAKWATFDIS